MYGMYSGVDLQHTYKVFMSRIRGFKYIIIWKMSLENGDFSSNKGTTTTTTCFSSFQGLMMMGWSGNKNYQKF